MKAALGARVSSGTIAARLRSPALVVLSVAVLAGITPPVTHEFIGHGSVCLAVGGHPTVVSTSMFWCTVPAPVVASGGPAANLLAGLICLMLRLRLRRPPPALQLYLTLVTAFAWFWEGGYAIQAMLLRRGDLYDLLAHTLGPPGIGMSILIALAGATLYIISAAVTRTALLSIAGNATLARHVSRSSWLAGTLAVTIAASISPLGPTNLLDTVLSIGLAGLPLLVFVPRRGASSITGNPFTGNAMLPVLTAVMWVLFTATLGHGITWGN
jgi:hypothetical protein